MYLPTKPVLPQKEYVPIRHFMAPKQYQPVNPNTYTDPGYDLKLPEYVKLPDQTLVPPSSNFHSDIKSPDNDPTKPSKDQPSSSYQPPSEGYKPPPSGDYLPPIPDLDELDELLSDDLKIPSRGPQFPVKDEFKLNSDYLAPDQLKSKYKEPPPRPKNQNQDLDAPSILNSQVVPPTSFEDKYIPPKTKFDVPKNFKRPGGAFDLLDDGLPEPPSPEEIATDIDDGFDEVDEFQQISEPPGPKPFLGLTKLRSPGSDDKDKEKDEKKDNRKSSATSKPAKLTLTDGPKLPPIPTLPPQPG